jgi:PAS domain S-box-containing protein
MGAAPAPEWCEEETRQLVLSEFNPDALKDDVELAAIVQFAAEVCDAPVALLSFVEPQRQRFLARENFPLRETPRSESFCAHTMLQGDPMQVRDASKDLRFSANSLVNGEQHVRFYAGAPLISAEGAPVGALCVIDRQPRPQGLTKMQLHGLQVLAQAAMCRMHSRRSAMAAESRESETARTMREIADLLPSIVWSSDENGNFDYFNSRWTEVTGCPRPKTTEDWRVAIHPDDAAIAFGTWANSMEQGEPFECEYRLTQRHGGWRWTLSRALPVRNAEGAITRWYGTLTDVDDGHRLSESRDLLARELSHRIKNIFAVVAGLVSIRARRREELQEFADELNEAIRALGRAHDFVRPVEGAKGDSLHGLLAELMAPYCVGADRVRIDGGDCEIGTRAATPLALIFHELATNSAKYGALSVEAGKIRIDIDCSDGDEFTRLHWREEGGPPIGEIRAEGFGTRVLTMAVESQLGGSLERRYLSTGLEVDLEFKTTAIRS